MKWLGSPANGLSAISALRYKSWRKRGDRPIFHFGDSSGNTRITLVVDLERRVATKAFPVLPLLMLVVTILGMHPGHVVTVAPFTMPQPEINPSSAKPR
jgi:hypothetical protein